MKLIDLKKFQELQSTPDSIRNICILAHVDHGKTTLADSLVASNGIISNKLAGKLRYLDSRPDEQLRGITMKSSLITLYHVYKNSEYIVNLIDSPGHVDFASEVSTAVRLCDGAIIVVDVVEGVCPQTRSALSISYIEGLKPVLILNKIDRLITEMKLTPLDAYVHLNQVLEQINAVMGELFTSDVMEKDEEKENATSSSNTENLGERNLADWQSALEEIDDSSLYFSPEQGNVLFASAIDGWGFTIKDFAKIFSEKLGFSEKVLSKTLWGDYYLNSKIKRIMKGAQEKAKKTLFVQLILENIWALYDTVVVRKDKEKIISMIEKLNIKLTTRDLRHTDPKAQLHAICTQWLPLAKASLGMVCENVPPPHKLSCEKIKRLISGANEFSVMPEETQKLEKNFLDCSSDQKAPIIVFISKMFPVDKKSLPENKPKLLTHEELVQRREVARQRHADKLEKEKLQDVLDLKNTEVSVTTNENITEEEDLEACENTLIAFARVYSGTLSIGSELYVLGPKHNPKIALEREKAGEIIDPTIQLKDLKSGRHITKVTISKLYILMGRELEPIDKVPAGNVIGIGNLEEHVLKTATLSSTVACPSFSELTLLAVPILRVALEPKHPNDLPKLVNGLKLLNQADACALVHIQETGEVVLNTAGEVHLERCLEDLKLRYAKVEVNVSEPIVSFRETIVPPPKVDMVNEVIEKKSEDINLGTWIWNQQCYFEIDAKPLPETVTKFLENNSGFIKELDKYCNNLGKEKEDVSDPPNISVLSLEISALKDKMQKNLERFKNELLSIFKEAGWQDDMLNKIWSFGPRKCGPNILLNDSSFVRKPFWEYQSTGTDSQDIYCNSIINGFQLATLSGPLCEEPMMGVCFVLKKWEIHEEAQSESVNLPQSHLSGQLMSACNQACRKAFNSRRPRLVSPMYSCSVLVNSDVLGTLDSGLGNTHINKLMTAVEIPPMHSNTYKRHEKEVGAAVESVAKGSCKAAALLERGLTLKNEKEVAKLLPENLQVGFINPDSIEVNNKSSIVRIGASYDMGWSTRGTGRNYDSLNGFGFLIGKESKKVCDYYTCNRKCRMCDIGHSPTDHDCRLNFYGSAKSMEASAAVKVTTESSILKECKLELGIFIGDDDSSTISALRDSSQHKVIKQSDLNHTSKGVTNELYKLKLKHKELKKDGIDHLHRCFTYAVAQDKLNSTEMAKAIRNIPNHSFNCHENCGNWCGFLKNPKTCSHSVIGKGFKNQQLFVDLENLFNKLANNCERFAAGASSQVNESLNATMAIKAPKSRCYSRSASSDYRAACTVSQKNIGLKYVPTILKKLNINPGTITKHNIKILTRKAMKRNLKASNPTFKKNRLLLKKNKSTLRNQKESLEGIMYQSNMGLLNTASLEKNVHMEICNFNDNELFTVYFDLETSSFRMNADILQVAAKCGSSNFSVYINPKQKIDQKASEANDLTNVEGNLFLNNVRVDSKSSSVAFHDFYTFLKNLNKKSILCAHNCKFDCPRFLNCIRKLGMMNYFESVIYGFCDTLPIIKKITNKNGKGENTLTSLAQILNIDIKGAHNALIDVHMLEQVVIKLNIPESSIIEYCDTWQTIAQKDLENKKIQANLVQFIPLHSCTSLATRKKLCKANITFEMLTAAFQKDELLGIKSLLGTDEEGQIRVTKNKSVINKIGGFFEKKIIIYSS